MRASAADFVALARPKDWLKNVFVVMPVPFGVATGGRFDPRAFGLGLLGFTLISAAAYALNDVLDAQRDRNHPLKRERPVAAGRIPRTAALTFSALLFLSGVLLLWLTGKAAAWQIALVYLTINVAYSMGGKRIALLDVFMLAAGFVLRVLLGCALLGVPASNWLLLCTSTLALLLALGKRRADVLVGLDAQHRPSLSGYSRGFLEQAIAITAGVTFVSYALYCIEAGMLRPGREFASLPFVAFGILEYMRLIHMRGEGSSPVAPGARRAHTGREAPPRTWLTAAEPQIGLFCVDSGGRAGLCEEEFARTGRTLTPGGPWAFDEQSSECGSAFSSRRRRRRGRGRRPSIPRSEPGASCSLR